jgi:hypothetical protein
MRSRPRLRRHERLRTLAKRRKRIPARKRRPQHCRSVHHKTRRLNQLHRRRWIKIDRCHPE